MITQGLRWMPPYSVDKRFSADTSGSARKVATKILK